MRVRSKIEVAAETASPSSRSHNLPPKPTTPPTTPPRIRKALPGPRAPPTPPPLSRRNPYGPQYSNTARSSTPYRASTPPPPLTITEIPSLMSLPMTPPPAGYDIPSSTNASLAYCPTSYAQAASGSCQQPPRPAAPNSPSSLSDIGSELANERGGNSASGTKQWTWLHRSARNVCRETRTEVGGKGRRNLLQNTDPTSRTPCPATPENPTNNPYSNSE
ncbi:proline-rich receptor-like protein kinase PERK2 [Osmia bicornis bicornis]|uniref:proline-rich receptor-like protein kinase PERK2 n=1 Tax=Osmia bicornis bicornis TaxID=1437191 RepID=UPI0010F835F3|nr:proline-rich receptor-like protein kinase PERK2 [Osmia bicornis bicornis]